MAGTIQFYTAATGNGHRVAIMLEESGLAYTAIPVDFAAQEHRGAALLAVNPMGQIPAILDPDGPDGSPVALGESAAVVAYLARKTGVLLPATPREQIEADRWTAITAGGLQAAPTTIFFAELLGRDAHAPIIAKQREMIDRYLAMMEARLSQSAFLAGDTFTYVDILGYTLVHGTLPKFGIALDGHAAIGRWHDSIAARPAVQRGLKVPSAP
ncbi:glutathione S-transferase family protein [Blastomonas fulva]|uniref:glutathione S-transferase family protein n=1 Tax=Blastomonas fulva TaxID=1550728 RepID=UPI003F72B81D